MGGGIVRLVTLPCRERDDVYVVAARVEMLDALASAAIASTLAPALSVQERGSKCDGRRTVVLRERWPAAWAGDSGDAAQLDWDGAAARGGPGVDAGDGAVGGGGDGA